MTDPITRLTMENWEQTDFYDDHEKRDDALRSIARYVMQLEDRIAELEEVQTHQQSVHRGAMARLERQAEDIKTLASVVHAMARPK